MPLEEFKDQALRQSEERFRLIAEGVQDYAVIRLDPQGHVLSWNAGAERIKGYRADEVLGRHVALFYPDELVQRGWPDRQLSVARQHGHVEDEGWRLRKDGTRFWANVVITSLDGPKGEPLGFLKITRDLTERREHERALRQSEERFRLLVDGVQDHALFMLDPDGCVMSWNAGAQRIKGYTAEEIIGSHFSRFYPQEAVARGWPQYELRVARETGRFEDEGWRIRKDGTSFWANVVITAVHDDEGRLRGFAKVTRDMTARKRILALEEAGRQTNEFLAMLAHELRNPLAPIRNALAILSTKGLADPGQQWARDLIERQVGHMTRLVDDLLDVSRITSGKITLQKQDLDMTAVVSGAVEASRAAIDARRHALSLSLPDAPVPIEGDLTRLSQVVMNLLNNAAKYTPEGGHIDLTVTREGNQAVMRVGDNGIGIAPEVLPRIFELFVQGERTLDRTEGGLGIGLTLVRQLVEMHGGAVSATSPGRGQGSEFVVRLPVRETSDRTGGKTGGKYVPMTQGRRVLVVDDNHDSVESMALLLGLWGHDVKTAMNGPTALVAAREHKPEVLLVDIGLPGMNGYELAARLRALPGLEGALLVAMTGYSQEEDRRRSREAGFDVHLVKPVEPPALAQLLAGLPPRT